MAERSMEMFGKAHEAESKFDYFVCGVAGAIFAYIVKDFVPRKFVWGIPTLEPASLCLLAFAFYFGLKRIEASKILNHFNHEALDASERAGEMTAALGKAGTLFNRESGEFYSQQEIARKRQSYLLDAQAIQEILPAKHKLCVRYYKLRNFCLVWGFFAILAAKLFIPYAASNLSVESLSGAPKPPEWSPARK
jgi:hypothetical protein